MEHLGMELYAPRHFAADMVSGHTHIICRADDIIIRRHGSDCVSMRHPHLRRRGKVFHQRIFRSDYSKHGATVFTAGSAIDLSSELLSQQLGAITYAEQRKPAFDAAQIQTRRIVIAH